MLFNTVNYIQYIMLECCFHTRYSHIVHVWFALFPFLILVCLVKYLHHWQKLDISLLFMHCQSQPVVESN